MKLEEIKKAMVHKSPIIHNGSEYNFISACIMRFRENEFVYTVELYDKSGHGVTIANLDKVELK